MDFTSLSSESIGGQALEVIFYSLIKFQDKNKFKCTNEAAIRKSLEIANSNN